MAAADWLDERDPWLPARMRHAARISHWEQRIGAAVVEATTRFLDTARAGVLGEAGSTGLTAAAEPPPPGEQPPPAPPPAESPAAPPPSLDGWPADVVWETLLADIVLPVIGDAFGEAFEAAYRTVITASEIEPFRVIYLGTVFDRLRLWPRGAFDEIRDELADGIAAGENVDQLRDRVGRALNIDARSRAIEARVAELDAHIDDPDTTPERRRAARAERRKLYNDLDVENSRWQWKARRIARTETIGSYSAGAYYSAEAWEQTSGDEMWLQWLSTSDTRTRGAHIVADGQVRRLGEPFMVGGVAMRFPGDPLAPADLVVNCRCALLALGADEAAEQQALYERTRPNRTDILGNKLDDLGRPIVAAAHLEDTMHDTPNTDVLDEVNDHDDADTDTGDEVDDVALPSRWRGVLAPLDTPSGDGRIIATPQELRTRPLPVPLLYQDALSPGHDGAIVVGAIDRAWIEDGALMGEGRFDLADPRSAEVVRRVADNFLGGVSVDLDDATSETRCMRDGQLVDCDDLIEVDDDGMPVGVADGVQAVDVATTWRLMAATLVSQPAFAEARIEAVADADHGAGPASYAVTGDADLPLADRDREWDGDAARARMTERAGGVGNIDPERMSEGFFWRDPDADPTNVTAYRLPFADVIDGTLTAVPRAIFAVAQRLNQADIPADARAQVESRVNGYYERMRDEFNDPDIRSPFDADALVAAAGWAPPREWFNDPGLPGPTPITVTNDGHVLGHLASWESCHTGFPGRCVAPPRDPSGGSYEYFHVGTVRTADGGDIPVGSLVIGTRHADLTDDAARAFAHYADTGQAVAAVRAGEDEHGIWVAGAILPGVTDDQVVTLRRSPLSGDWRPIGGQQRLVAALAVNVPGFPLPRHRTDEVGRPAAMVAAGVVYRPRATTAPVDAAAVMPSAGEIAAALHREIQLAAARARTAGQLQQRMTGPRVAALTARMRSV